MASAFVVTSFVPVRIFRESRNFEPQTLSTRSSAFAERSPRGRPRAREDASAKDPAMSSKGRSRERQDATMTALDAIVNAKNATMSAKE